MDEGRLLSSCHTLVQGPSGLLGGSCVRPESSHGITVINDHCVTVRLKRSTRLEHRLLRLYLLCPGMVTYASLPHDKYGYSRSPSSFLRKFDPRGEITAPQSPFRGGREAN